MPCLQPFRGDSAQLLLYKIASCLSDGGFVAGVSSFNGQTGLVTFTGSDIITLLGFTPISQADGDTRYVLKAGDTMTGALVHPLGTAALPSITFTGDLDTGVYSPGADTVGISIAGVQRLLVAAAVAETVTGTATGIFAITSDANTATISDTILIEHVSSGTVAVGFGSKIKFISDTNGSVDRTQSSIESSWTVALDATRTSQLAFATVNSAASSTDLILTAGQAQFRLGSVSAPSITFQGDLNTGFYSSADVIGLTAGGSNKFFISTTGTFIVGGFHLSYIAKTANYTATAADQTIDCTANTFTITLPTAVGITGRIYTVKNSGVGSITIDPNGAQTIDSLATATVVSGASITTMSNGANWIII